MGLVDIFGVAKKRAILTLYSFGGFVDMLDVKLYCVFVFEEFSADGARDVFLLFMNLSKVLLHSSIT